MVNRCGWDGKVWCERNICEKVCVLVYRGVCKMDRVFVGVWGGIIGWYNWIEETGSNGINKIKKCMFCCVVSQTIHFTKSEKTYKFLIYSIFYNYLKN